ncbi:MAG: TRAP transporter small permease [Burkholderiales bacterium]|nr:TRAP transporter small permease [Burkholderiales bacterium]
MKFFGRAVGALARVGIALAAVALLTSMAVIAYSVVMRYALNQPVPWVDELAGYLLVACVMLAAADALRQGEHIAVDIVTERLSRRARRWTARFGLVAVALSALLLAVQGYDMVAFSRMVGLMSNGYLAVPMWIPQLLVPVGAVLLLLAALAEFATPAADEPESGDDGASTPLDVE